MWFVISVAWITGVIGIIIVMLIPNVYTSEATVFVDTQSLLLKVIKSDVVIADPNRQVENVRRIMYTYHTIEKLITRSDLDLYIDTPREKEELIRRIEKKLRLTRESRDFYSIAFSAKSPLLAQKIVTNILNIFIEENISRNVGGSDTAKTFIDHQINNTIKKIENLDRKIADFQRDNSEELVDYSAIIARKQGIEMNLRSLRNDYSLLNSQISQLNRQLGSVQKYIDKSATGSRTNLSASSALRNAERKYEQAITVMKPGHPDIIAMEKNIQALKREVEISGEAEKIYNPIYQSINSQLQQYKNSFKTTGTQIVDSEKRLMAIRAIQEKQPEILQKFDKMITERTQHESKLESLREKLSRTELSDDVVRRASIVDFRVVDPPYLPIAPSFPSRLLLLVATCLFSISGAIACCVVKIRLSEQIHSMSQFRRTFDLNLFGSVSTIVKQIPRNIKIKEFALPVIAITAYFIMFAIFIYLYHIKGWDPVSSIFSAQSIMLL